jgi:hypothetical protein
MVELTMNQTANSMWDFVGAIGNIGGTAQPSGLLDNWIEYGIVVDGIAGPVVKQALPPTGLYNISAKYTPQLTAGAHTGYVQWRVPTGLKPSFLQSAQLSAVGLQGVVGPAGGIGLTSVSTVTVSAGTIVLTATQASTPVLYLTGTLTGNVTLQAPLGNSTMFRIWGGHNSNGYYVTFGSSSGNTCWIAPNQFTEVLCDGTNWNYITYGNPVQVSVNVPATMAVGATSVPLYSIPVLAPYGAVRISAAELFVKAVPTAGATVAGVGSSSGGYQLVQTCLPSGISNVYGSFTSELGSDMSAARGYQARYTGSGVTIYYNQIQTGAAASTGTFDINVITYFEGAI